MYFSSISLCLIIFFFLHFFSLLFSIANIISLCHGLAIGWLSPNLLKLQSNESPLQSGPMTLSETSWIGSCFSIGAILGNCFFGLLSNYLGRKNTLCILALPNLVNRFSFFNLQLNLSFFVVFLVISLMLSFFCCSYHLLFLMLFGRSNGRSFSM